MNIGEVISKSIKESKWLNISYHNKEGQETYYWISVKDINPEKKSLFVTIYNFHKSSDTKDAWIYFDSIKTAEIIDFSYYEVPEKLISKIEANLSKYDWLNYDHFNHNVLYYYQDCLKYDSDPCQNDYADIRGIDYSLLSKERHFVLNKEQEKRIVEDIYHFDLKASLDVCYTLAINALSIDKNNKKYVVCYYEVQFNPTKHELVLDKRLRFNQMFMIEGRRYSLFNYINMDMNEFMATYEKEKEHYQAAIQENLRNQEIINTRPEIMLLRRDLSVDLTDTFNVIDKKYNSNSLPTPLKSFFGNITRRNNVRKKEPSLILCDEYININQMRVIYNAMKYPVTYVQGPPGTGKTQTIINVVLCAFYDDKDVLICSSNNKPVNGIVEKLRFQYKGKIINFPFLRLGNIEDVKKATLKIKELYEFTYPYDPNEDKLNKIKNKADDNNSKLIEMLNIQEQRVEIENCLESSQKLIKSFGDKESKVIDIVKNKIHALENDLKQLPEIDNDELISLFEPLNKNPQLSQYLFFKSLLYIEKLKKPRFGELIRICSIGDDDTRALEFNKWTNNDDNMRMLMDAFPVIFTTNISARRLGSPNIMFDLVIMDEAGQCNAATALIPITKANNLLLVGDPNQLRPVIILETEMNEQLKAKYNIQDKYDYKNHSILDVMLENDNISKYILLKYHYRCGKKIINYSNQRYYGGALHLEHITDPGELQIMQVKNQNVKNKNEAFDEAQAIIDYIKRNNVHDAFIITPFVNQKELIQNLLQSNNINDIDCGTIHSIQGAEKDTIIFSPAISYKTSKKTFEWLKNNYELLNVATTRAKHKLIIAADVECIEKMSDKKDDLYTLIQYTKNNGQIVVPPNESIKMEIGNSNASNAEDEFYETISQFCSCHKVFEAERNVKLSKLFKGDSRFVSDEHEFDLVLYDKSLFSKKPVIAFEINGGEHLGSVKTEKSDNYKMKVCKEKGIKLIFIPNSFVKSYEYIADIIYSSKRVDGTIQQSMFDLLES